VVIAVVVGGYFAIGFVAKHWLWFASAAILLGGTALAAWALFRSPRNEAPDRGLLAEREELMSTVDRMHVGQFDAMVAELLTRLDAKRVKRFGHRQNNLGCNFVVTLRGGRRIIVRAKKDDRTLKREGTRHIQLLGGEIHPRWNCDAGVLITNANLHRMRQATRNEAMAAQLGVLVMDRHRLAEWIETGEPPALLRPVQPAITAGQEAARRSAQQAVSSSRQ
jgi:hypothetical protein